MSILDRFPPLAKPTAEVCYRGRPNIPLSKWKLLTHAEQMELDELLNERPGMVTEKKGDPLDKVYGKGYHLIRREKQTGQR